MNCNSCGSDNVQRLEVVFDNGTQNIDTKSGSTGIGFGKGGVGVGFGATKTKGTSKSNSAIKASPPAKKKLIVFIISFFAGIMLATDKNAGVNMMLFGGIIILINSFIIYKNIKFNKNEYPKLYQLWLESWMCNKCGSIFR